MRQMALGAAAVAVIGLFAAGKAVAQEAPETIAWRAPSSSLERIPHDLAALYLNLYNQKRLPIRTLTDPRVRAIDAGVVETLLREQGLLIGNHFPVEIEALVCELNRPALCDRERPVANADLVTDMSRHVGGRLPTPGHWQAGSVNTIVLPDITFVQKRRLTRYPKRKNQRLEGIVAELGSCRSLDEPCLELLDDLNRVRPAYSDPLFEGEIQVPGVSLSAAIDVSCPPGACAGGFDAAAARLVQRQIGHPAQNLPPPGTPDMEGAAPAYGSRVGGQDLVPAPAESFRGLNRNLWKGSETGAYSAAAGHVSAEELFAAQERTLAFVNYPWQGKLPTSLQARVVVGIVEGPLNAEHCDLVDEGSDRLVVVQVPETLSGEPVVKIPKTAAPCSDGGPDKGKTADHGTHVAGIIAARLNGKGITGLNPYARLHVLVVNDGKMRLPEHQGALDIQLEELMLEERVSVINISRKWIPLPTRKDDETGAITPALNLIQETIKRHEEQVLYVVAAGQDYNVGSYDYSPFCDIFPACLELPNVLSVVALEGDPDQPVIRQDAHYGMRFGIGAHGTGVVSTGTGGGFVTLDGSSMAAPQVTAIASLLFAAVNTVTPAQVKNRLLACATPAVDLEGKVWSGKLDAACSLDQPKADRLMREGSPQPLTGGLEGLEDENGKPVRHLRLLEQATDTEFAYLWPAVYALRRDPSGSGRFILFTRRQPKDAARTMLDRRAGLAILDKDAKVLFRPSGGNLIKIPLREVSHFISGIKDQE